MPRFLVIPRDPPEAFTSMSPEEMQVIVERYVRWTRDLGERLEAGDKLVDAEGRVLRPGDAPGRVSATDGPYAETKEVVGGFWIIRADDLDHAERLVSDCPHLEHGSLELRRIDELEA